LKRAGVAGPLFISVGQPDQLAKFLEINPELANAKALVDTSPDFAGYRQAGFNILMGDAKLDKPPDFKPPTNIGPRKWMTYLANTAKLAPIPKDMKFGEVPNGVRVLGGTYAIDGNAVTFAHMDKVPGATPDINDVLAVVGA